MLRKTKNFFMILSLSFRTIIYKKKLFCFPVKKIGHMSSYEISKSKYGIQIVSTRTIFPRNTFLSIINNKESYII